jgi:ComEC/Rec2-related protein
MPLFKWPEHSSALVSWGACAFLFGVLVHAAFPFDQTPSEVVFGLGGATVVAAFIPWRARLAIVVCFLGCAFGLWRFDQTLPGITEPSAEFTGEVIAQGPYSVLVRDQGSGMVISVNVRNRVGDRVRVICSRVEPIAHDAKAVFDARKGAWFKCKGKASARLLGPAPGRHPGRVLDEWRIILTRRIQGIMPGDAGALLSGILYGERGLSKETSAAFKTAGMTHLIAVSGSNIAIVISLFVPCFLFIGYRRKPAIVLSGAAVALFVLFVGAQASVIRAALMGWLALLARVFGRKASAGRLLAIAATTIVLFDPWALSFDAGFALSFLATWGLLSWSRPLQEWLRWMPEAFGLREAASTTLAATLVTFPYSLWAFDGASIAGLLTNLFAVPIGGLAMLWGTVAVAVSPLVPVVALPGRGCLEAMLAIARTSELAPWLKITWTLPTWALFLIYTLLLAYSVRRGKKISVYPQSAVHEAEISPLLRGAVRGR